MTRRARTLLCLVLLAAPWAAGGVGIAAAAEDDWDVAAVAKGILEATDSEREAKLVAAARSDANPWLLAEHLRVLRAAPAILTRYAVLASKRAPELGAYVADVKRPVPKPEALAAIEKARRHLVGGEPAAALKAVVAVRVAAEPPSVTAAAAARVEALAHADTPALAPCVLAARRAGDLAAGIGWSKLAHKAYLLGLRMAHAASMLEDARACARGLWILQEAAGDTLGMADSHKDIAGIDYRRGDLPSALRHFDEALALYAALEMPADAGEIYSLRAVVYAHMGDLRRALDDLGRVIEPETLWRKDAAALAEFWSNAAIVQTRLGNAEEARSLLDRAMNLARRKQDVFAEAIAVGNRGLVERMEGEWEQAIGSYRSAIALFETEEDGLSVALGQLALADGHMRRARETLQRAEGITASAKQKLAAEARRDCLAARSLLDTAGALLSGAHAAGSAAAAFQTRCQVLLTLGELENLEKRFGQARNEARRLGLWKTLVKGSEGLVALHVRKKAWNAAIDEARDAVETIAAGYGGLTDGDVARARSYDADVVDLGVRAAATADRAEDVHYFMERGRGAALLRGLGGRGAALRATVPAALLEQLRELTTAKARAMTELHTARRRGKHQDIRAKHVAYEKLRDEEAAVQLRIEAHEVRAASRLAPPRIERLREVRRRLAAQPAGAPPMLYVAFNLQARDAWVLVVDAKRGRLVHLDDERVKAIHTALKALVEDRYGDIPEKTLIALRTHLIAPLKLPPGRLRLLISPDRELAYVPYSALLADDVTYALVPSATTWALLEEDGHMRGKGILAIGDPDYEHAPDKRVFERRGGSILQRLPLAKTEIRAITRGPHDVELLGREATEERLLQALGAKDEARRWRAVHFVCHGLVDVEWPAYSALALTASAQDDGMLTAGELMRLPMRTDLAVLSACQTGRGRYVRAEGIMGLTRACMYAGAPRVIASLWKVDDKATNHLMQAFHRHWKAGRTPARALRLAQADIRDHVVIERSADGTTKKTRPWASPAYWAAWVLWGLPD